MSHQHDRIYTDEETSATIGSHQIPIPMNWKVLVQPNQVKMKTAGGILLPDTSKDNEEYLTAHGTVCAMGDLAYPAARHLKGQRGIPDRPRHRLCNG